MSETEDSANHAAKVEASDELTVSTTPPSGDNGESAEAQDANVADVNALQSSSAGLRVTSSVKASPSVSPAADLSSNKHQTASAEPAYKNPIIEVLALLNDIDVNQPIGTKCDTNHSGPSDELQKYPDDTKVHDDLSNELFRIQEKLKVS